VSVFANLYTNAEALATRALEVKTSADQLRLLTDVAPIGIFQTDIENRYVYVNPRWCEITGLSREIALGSTLGAMLGANADIDVVTKLAGPALPGAEISHRYEIQAPDSSMRIALLTAVSIPNTQGGAAGWAGTLADITAEAGAEVVLSDARDAATQASSLKSDFLANMSHEIRTPMNGVIGMTDLLLETDLDERQLDYAQTVRNSGEALLTIINDILDFSKVEAGMLEIENNEFDVRLVVHDVVDLLASSAQTKNLELVAIVESSVPALVRGDSGRLRQVLMNLVGNAIKFTQAGEVVVRVAESEVAGTDTLIHFEVRDTGDGIAPEQLDEIFQPFVQADTSTSRRYGGTGLGLAISGHLVTLMGGDYGVASQRGEGSTFWFTVRVHTVAPATTDCLPTPYSSHADLAGLKALIVDDNASQRDVLSKHLTAWGMTVTTADAGQAALAILRRGANEAAPFAVALVDRSMPDMDGLELKDAIVRDPAVSTPLVLMIGLGQDRDLANADTSGFCAVLSRPSHRANLLACLRIALNLQLIGMSPAEVVTPRSAFVGSQMGRLLLAEDNLVNQKVAVAMLSSVGYQVDTVLDGALAVEMSAMHDYDAILMDCQMPGLSGYEATAAIRAREGSSRHTPIIAMTAGARSEDRERCLSAGMDSYLSKPASKDALLALVAASLKTGTAARVPDHPPAPVAMPSSVPPALDVEVLDQLERLGQMTGEDLIGQLATLFLADADIQLSALRLARGDEDAGAVNRIAHALSGASANLGATELARLCRILATPDGATELFGNESMLMEVASELTRVRVALDSHSRPSGREVMA
jgi:two-component system sensor histidine kinase/response regulator